MPISEKEGYNIYAELMAGKRTRKNGPDLNLSPHDTCPGHLYVLSSSHSSRYAVVSIGPINTAVKYIRSTPR